MESHRRIALIVGALYILASVTGIMSAVFLGPVLDDSEYLTRMSDSEGQVIAGAAFFFIMSVSVAGIAIALYPILKRQDESLALGYVAARVVEGALFVVSIALVLTLLTLSQEFVDAGSPDDSYYQVMGESLMAADGWIETVFVGLIFCLSALILNYLLYLSKLVPRWISIWGLVGAVLYPVAATSLLGEANSGVFYAPLAVQEMVFAVWLIVKGFSLPSIAVGSAGAETEVVD